MTPFVQLTDILSVAGVMTPDDIARAGELGFRSVINNRPDGESPDQVSGADLETAALAVGLGYTAIPVAQGFTMDQVRAMADALATDGPILAFCRSGTRSTNLWALAEAFRGEAPETLIEAAAIAGYDISGLLPTLQGLAAKS
jgi:uncharacterized protein (TIGR01244 family)